MLSGINNDPQTYKIMTRFITLTPSRAVAEIKQDWG
jgi:hypothetical protein